MRNTFKALFVAVVMGSLIILPASSYAYWNGHDNGHAHGHDNGHGHDGGHGHSYIGVNFSLWPDSYYYGAPYYSPVDEVLVSPPVYQPVVINGATYYLYDGTYYTYNGYSYQAIAPPGTVVQQPVSVIQPPVVIANQEQPVEDSFTINIPNDKGGYTAVTLKRSGSGFTGPQGEFYPEFPKVFQLKVIYGK